MQRKKGGKKFGFKLGFSPLKPKKIKNPSYRTTYKRRYHSLFLLLGHFLRLIRRFFIAIVFFVAVVVVYLVLRTDVFIVEKIKFTGVDQTPRDKLQLIADEYKGQNIYSIKLSDVESDVKDVSVYIKDAYAHKHLPNEVRIDIVERYPVVAVVNFDGVYLLDKDYTLTSVPVRQSIEFSDEEWDLYLGQDITSNLVKNRLLANMAEEEDFDEETFDFEVVEEEKKIEVMMSIISEMDQIISQHFNDLEIQINASEYAGLRRIHIYDSGDFEEGQVVLKEKITSTIAVLDMFERYDWINVTKATWVSKFTLEIDTLENQKYVFGTSRDIDNQIQDLEVILKQFKLEGREYTRLDLRGKVLRVK